jgi:type IV pilus assembly protein PilV
MRCFQARHRGFTLVEVLVALVVMAVGMLGIAALYVEGLRAGRTSVNRTSAITLAGDMGDRIQANSLAAASYVGNGPGADNACVNGVVDCAPAAIAADDWFHWYQDVQRRLPTGATANIVSNGLIVGGVPVAEYQITLNWPETGQDQPSSYTLVLRL